MSWFDWFVAYFSIRPLRALAIILAIPTWIITAYYLLKKFYLKIFCSGEKDPLSPREKEARERKKTAEARMEIHYRSLQAEEEDLKEKPSERFNVCPVCNSAVPADSVFCPACGSEQKEEESRLPRDGLSLTEPLFYSGEAFPLTLGVDQRETNKLPQKPFFFDFSFDFGPNPEHTGLNSEETAKPLEKAFADKYLVGFDFVLSNEEEEDEQEDD